jgi:hypothetical protein
MIDRIKELDVSIVVSSMVPIVLILSAVLQSIGRHRFLRAIAKEVVPLGPRQKRPRCCCRALGTSVFRTTKALILLVSSGPTLMLARKAEAEG